MTFFLSFCFLLLEGVCDSKCGVRCLNAGVKDRCLKYCGLCCQQCNCVPSGTYGNKSECPCYRDKLNSKGKSKCPWFHFSFIFPPLKSVMFSLLNHFESNFLSSLQFLKLEWVSVTWPNTFIESNWNILMPCKCLQNVLSKKKKEKYF